MQLQGKDTIIKSYIGTNGQHLNLTTAGFQFGADKDRSIVTSIEQVKDHFSVAVQDEVRAWLDRNGVQEATKHLMDREVAEQASEEPGTLDALANKLGPEVKAQLFQMLKGALHGKAEQMPPSPVMPSGEAPIVEDSKGVKHRLPDPVLAEHPRVTEVPGGVILDKGNGHKEFRADYSADEQEEQELLDARDRAAGVATATKSVKKRR